MKQIKIGSRLLQVGLILWIIKNFYFGWNETPVSFLELRCHYSVNAFFSFGILFYILPIFKLYEKAVKKNELK